MLLKWYNGRERTGVVLYSGIQGFSESSKKQQYIQL